MTLTIDRDAYPRADESLDRQRPRGITSEQRAGFLVAAANQPKGSVTVIPVIGNAEAEPYARQLADLLRAGGYGVEASGLLPMDNTPIGLRPTELLPLRNKHSTTRTGG